MVATIVPVFSVSLLLAVHSHTELCLCRYSSSTAPRKNTLSLVWVCSYHTHTCSLAHLVIYSARLCRVWRGRAGTARTHTQVQVNIISTTSERLTSHSVDCHVTTLTFFPLISLCRVMPVVLKGSALVYSVLYSRRKKSHPPLEDLDSRLH